MHDRLTLTHVEQRSLENQTVILGALAQLLCLPGLRGQDLQMSRCADAIAATRTMAEAEPAPGPALPRRAVFAAAEEVVRQPPPSFGYVDVGDALVAFLRGDADEARTLELLNNLREDYSRDRRARGEEPAPGRCVELQSGALREANANRTHLRKAIDALEAEGRASVETVTGGWKREDSPHVRTVNQDKRERLEAVLIGEGYQPDEARRMADVLHGVNAAVADAAARPGQGIPCGVCKDEDACWADFKTGVRKVDCELWPKP